jgi:EAL domain-containing protein (putative c-di-GMP-specific phosphodiesterase class I)
LVSPAEFIPLAEDTGLIIPIGEWVLRTACAQIREWRHAGLAPVPVAVNISPKQFHQQDLAEVVRRALRDHEVDAALLDIEITESTAMCNPEATSTTLRDLKALGVRIAIDDFGTGYSSLSYLKRFPIDSLKIDRSFITGLPGDRDDGSIARAVITMAHALRLNVVAEGVENAAQLSFLAAHGCDEMQGFYFSRPVPAEQLTALLRDGGPLPLVSSEPARLAAAG